MKLLRERMPWLVQCSVQTQGMLYMSRFHRISVFYKTKGRELFEVTIIIYSSMTLTCENSHLL